MKQPVLYCILKAYVWRTHASSKHDCIFKIGTAKSSLELFIDALIAWKNLYFQYTTNATVPFIMFNVFDCRPKDDTGYHLQIHHRQLSHPLQAQVVIVAYFSSFILGDCSLF